MATLPVAIHNGCSLCHSVPHRLEALSCLSLLPGGHRAAIGLGQAPCCPWAIDHHSNPGGDTMIVEAQVTINGSEVGLSGPQLRQIENASETIQRNRTH